MFKKITFVGSLLFVFTYMVYGQKDMYNGKYGGPFMTISNNRNGISLSVGGGGTFYIKDKFYVGVFGQGVSAFFPESSFVSKLPTYDLKSKFTGFWLGYFQTFNPKSKFYLSYYTKVGFGKVYLDNDTKQRTYYDYAILISPHIEPIISVTPFFKIGLGVFYDLHFGVDLFDYKNEDFDAFGLSFSLRFVGP